MATVALSGIITPTNVVTATSTTTLTNKTLTGAVMNGTLGATTPSTVVATTVKASTTIGVGAATPSASGAGISFPATQSASSDANTLDDYEEGTFTPTMFGNTTAGTATYNIQTGTYTKIGRTVSFQLHLDWSGHTGTGGSRIGGLPFTSSSAVASVTVGFVDNLALTAGKVLMLLFASGSVNINVRQTPTGGGAWDEVNIDAAAVILVSGTYFV